jgi:hypothetical protein
MNSSNIETVEQLLNELKESYAIDSIEKTVDVTGNGEIEINYSFTAEYAIKRLNYEFADQKIEDAPETFTVEGSILIELKDFNIVYHRSTVDVFDCKAMMREGDWEDFQLDNTIIIQGFNENNLIDYLSELNSMLDVNFVGTNPGTAFEIIFEGQTHPYDSYRNTYVKCATRNKNIFVSVTTNHVSQNHNEYNGRSPWERIEKWEEKNKCKFIEEFSSIFPEIEQVLK